MFISGTSHSTQTHIHTAHTQKYKITNTIRCNKTYVAP